MSELLALATSLVDRAGPGEHVEAFLIHNKKFEVRAFEGEVESLSSAEPRGAGVRVVAGDHVGFAFTTDLTGDGLDDVVERARANARYATPDPAAGLAAGSTSPSELTGMFDEAQTYVPPEAKVRFALELERSTRSLDPRVRVVEDSVYEDSVSEVALATTTGIADSYRRTDAWCYSVAIVEERGDTQMGFDFGLGRSLSELDAESVARAGVARAVRVLGGKKIASARMPVIFDPYTSAQFLGVVGSVLTAEAVQKKRSLFAGRLGEEVAATSLSLIDDGRWEGAPAAAPWDAEGVPTRRTEVIKDGVLESFLYDTKSARRDGRASTGNAARISFKGVPHPSPSNMGFVTTGETRDELLARAGNAFFVQDFHGVHSGANAVTGDFSVGATGLLLDGGDVVQPVKEVTIAAPMLEILRGIGGVATDLRWLPFEGAYAGATTLVAEMTVGGA